MDSREFDRLTLLLSRTPARRRLGGALAALGLAGLAAVETEAKKKKKKCKKPKAKCGKKCCTPGQVCRNGQCAPAEECRIAKSASLWTLEADCTITRTIEIPNGVTFDGDGKTITMSGNVASFTKDVPENWRVSAGVLANGGSANVQDLTIKGGNLSGSCNLQAAGVEGLAFINTSGTIERVTVQNLRLQDDGFFNDDSCGIGISTTGTGGQTVDIVDVDVTGSGSVGIVGLSRADTDGIIVNIDGATVATDDEDNSLPNAGIEFSAGPVAGSITDTTITVSGSNASGINIFGGGSSTARTVDIEEVTIAAGDVLGGIAVFTSGDYNVSITALELTYGPGEGVNGTQLIGAGLTATVSDSILQNANVIAGEGSTVTLENNALAGGGVGVVDGASATVVGNTITEATFGVSVGLLFGPSPGTADVTTNTIVGPAADASQAVGIFYFAGASGTVDGNAVSNYFDTDPEITSCGIGLAEDAGEVTLSDNTFPPPGNEQDVCDPLPLPPAPRARRANGDNGFANATRGRTWLEQSRAAAEHRAGAKDRTRKGRARRDRGNDGGKHDRR